MTKTILGPRPAAFAAFDVRFIGPDGQERVIPDVVFKYRTRKEFAKFTDAYNQSLSESGVPLAGAAFTVENYWGGRDKVTFATLLQSIDGWGLPDPVSAEALADINDEMPAAIQALWAAYSNAARDGRLGN